MKTKNLNSVGNFVFGSKEYCVKKEICFYRRRSTIDFKIVGTYVRCHCISQHSMNKAEWKRKYTRLKACLWHMLNSSRIYSYPSFITHSCETRCFKNIVISLYLNHLLRHCCSLLWLLTLFSTFCVFFKLVFQSNFTRKIKECSPNAD